ncbi:CYTH-like domain-containing protein [Chytridium lagenaria]|nr:CYTH-like domain-containing protein [Chytridium lagenaria]
MSLLDCRISVNLESQSIPQDRRAEFTRDKDRLSYVHQAFRVDLTQITDSQNSKKMHELEIEFVDCKHLVGEKSKMDARQPNQYSELVCQFVNNIRALSRELNKIGTTGGR